MIVRLRGGLVNMVNVEGLFLQPQRKMCEVICKL